jgi:hypothetical protein
MAKDKKVNAPIVEENEERTAMFGWCSTGHHDTCVVRIPRYKCACKCHGGKDG